MRHIEAQLIHDMTNAATVIHGAAETLHSHARSMPIEAIDDLTGMLARRSDMLIRLMHDLSTVHALDRGDLRLQLQTVNLATTLSEVVEDHRNRIEGSFKIDIDPEALVLADPVRIVQILDNLLSNAARYGGRNVALVAWREGAVVRIAVSDDGPGVAPELVNSLFDLYSRGSASRQLGGSGLGLAIVQQLCCALGGSIEYDDREGATFVATLPAVPNVVGRPGTDAARQGHSVSFWVNDGGLADAVADYAANGLVAGEGVVIAATSAHRALVETILVSRGFDLVTAERIGQYVPLDATEIRDGLVTGDHIDPKLFNEVVADTITGVDNRWQKFRVFGEIVDLYWRDGEGHLALELEACWNQLRAEISFPLYCGYEIASGQDRVCDCHEAVLVA